MLEDIIAERKKKLERYRTEANPYPAESRRDCTLAEVRASFSEFEQAKKELALIGRVRAWRDQGKIIFAAVEDMSGNFQFVLDETHTEQFALLQATVDGGDFVEAHGTLFQTKRGEMSLMASRMRILTKSLRPAPQSFYGLEDIETRLRKRYLDLMTHTDVRDIFVKKSMFWSTIRAGLVGENFLEVETPVLEAVPGGAEAEPFVTHHNALDRDFYLRISLELPLKKMLVGGYEKVFEIGRIFRNEGIDREHLQDYTQMECYWAYADYENMMAFVEKLYTTTIQKVFGTTDLTIQGEVIHWGEKWPRVDYYEIFKESTGLDLTQVTDAELLNRATELKLKIEKGMGRGRLIDLIYKKLVRPKLVQPCFLIDPPVEVEPLAKRLARDTGRVARFQVLAAGTELGKGFSELNDPIDQRQRFESQMALRAQGDAEAQRLDEDFLEALEYGMPPAAGFGMSERLFAVLMDKPVREAVVFPLMKQSSE